MTVGGQRGPAGTPYCTVHTYICTSSETWELLQITMGISCISPRAVCTHAMDHLTALALRPVPRESRQVNVGVVSGCKCLTKKRKSESGAGVETQAGAGVM